MPQVKSVFIQSSSMRKQNNNSGGFWSLHLFEAKVVPYWAFETLNLLKCVVLDFYKQWLWPVVGCFIVPFLKSANIGSDPDCIQQSHIFLWNYYLLVWKLRYFQSFVRISLHLNFSIFPTHSLLISREKLKFNFRRKTLKAFWKMDSLSSETISNGHIDFLSRLRLWNHNECY